MTEVLKAQPDQRLPEEVPVFVHGHGLELSTVEKLTSVARSAMAGPNSVRKQGQYFVAKEPNSFGLPSVETCPGSTEYCEQDCYAIESERRSATYEKLRRNLEVLESAGTEEAMGEEIRNLVSNYKEEADRLGIPEGKRRFRIHWDGDFYNEDYARAWALNISENTDIQFWVYTRSITSDVNVLPILYGLPNLDLFVSVDRDNVDTAATALREFSDVRVAYLVDHYEEAKELREKLGRVDGFRGLACPENMRDDSGKRKLQLISEKGGACSVCTYCIGKSPNWDVVFVKSGKMFRAENELPFDDFVPVEIRPKRNKFANVTKSAGSLAVTESQFTLF